MGSLNLDESDQPIAEGRNIIRSLVAKEHFVQLPTDLRLLQLACPNSINNPTSSCPPSDELCWKCSDCGMEVMYDAADGGSYFYCECGRVPRGSHQFRCDACSEREQEFIDFPAPLELGKV